MLAISAQRASRPVSWFLAVLSCTSFFVCLFVAVMLFRFSIFPFILFTRVAVSSCRLCALPYLSFPRTFKNSVTQKRAHTHRKKKRKGNAWSDGAAQDRKRAHVGEGEGKGGSRRAGGYKSTRRHTEGVQSRTSTPSRAALNSLIKTRRRGREKNVKTGSAYTNPP